MAKRPKRNYEAYFNQASSVLQKLVLSKELIKIELPPWKI